jgi:hypothetical protein
MKQTFKIKGRLVFDPPEITSKHSRQSNWKKVAFLEFDGDIKKYYRWFVKKRYNLHLSESIRKAHVTFINDSHRDLGENLSKWNKVKKKWNGKTIEIKLSTDVHSDGVYWWLVVPEESRGQLHSIRKEVGLYRPHFGLHMTFGVAVNTKDDSLEGNALKATRQTEAHSKYIVDLLIKNLIE